MNNRDYSHKEMQNLQSQLSKVNKDLKGIFYGKDSEELYKEEKRGQRSSSLKKVPSSKNQNSQHLQRIDKEEQYFQSDSQQKKEEPFEKKGSLKEQTLQNQIRQSVKALNLRRSTEKSLLHNEVRQFFLSELIMKNTAFQKKLWNREKIGQRQKMSFDFATPCIHFSGDLLQQILAQTQGSDQRQVMARAYWDQSSYQDRIVFSKLCKEDGIEEMRVLQGKIHKNNQYLQHLISVEMKKRNLSERELQQLSSSLMTDLESDGINQIDFLDKENNNQSNKFSQNKFGLLEPVDLLRMNTRVVFDEQSEDQLSLNIDILAPNLTFEYQKVIGAKISAKSIDSVLATSQSEEPSFTWGYMSMDSQRQLLPLSLANTSSNPILGIWVSNVPPLPQEHEAGEVRHPLVWSQCVRFVAQTKYMQQVCSISTDLNTFLVCHLEQQKQTFYEFKCVRKDEERKTLNNWNIISLQKQLSSCQSFVFKPQVMKKTTIQQIDRYKVFSYQFYIDRCLPTKGKMAQSVEGSLQRKAKNGSLKSKEASQDQKVLTLETSTEGLRRLKKCQSNVLNSEVLGEERSRNNSNFHSNDNQLKGKESTVQQQIKKNFKRKGSAQSLLGTMKQSEIEPVEVLEYDTQNEKIIESCPSPQNHRDLETEAKFQQIFTTSQRQNRNLGKFVPNLKKSQVFPSQKAGPSVLNIKTTNQNSKVSTVQTSPFMAKVQRKNGQSRERIISSLEGNIQGDQEEQKTQGKTQSTVSIFESMSNMIRPGQGKEKEKENQKWSGVMGTPNHGEGSMFQQKAQTNIKIDQLGSIYSPGALKNTLNPCKSFEDESIERPKVEDNPQKKLNFDDIDSKPIKDYSGVIEKTDSSPTTKQIMREQARSIKMLQQEVQDLKELLKGIAQPSGEVSRGKQLCSNKTRSSNSHFNSSQTSSNKTSQTTNSRSKEEGQNSQPKAKNDSLEQNNPFEVKEGSSLDQNKLFMAFLDFCQSNGFNEIIQSRAQGSVAGQGSKDLKSYSPFSVQSNATKETNQVPIPTTLNRFSPIVQLSQHQVRPGSASLAPQSNTQSSSSRNTAKNSLEVSACSKKKEVNIYATQQQECMKKSMISLQGEGHDSNDKKQEDMDNFSQLILKFCQESPIMRTDPPSDIGESDKESKAEQKGCYQKLMSPKGALLSNPGGEKGKPQIKLLNKMSAPVYTLLTTGSSKIQSTHLKYTLPSKEEKQETEREDNSFTRSVLAEGSNMAALATNRMNRQSNGGNQADDEETTMKDSDVSLAIFLKKLHNI